jgi:hypothetical protein
VSLLLFTEAVCTALSLHYQVSLNGDLVTMEFVSSNVRTLPFFTAFTSDFSIGAWALCCICIIRLL